MAAAKIRVSDIAKRMGKSEKDVIFQLQSLGAEVTDPSQVLEPEVIQALITGKKLVTRTRSVIMREDKPQPEKKKEAVRPPRPIVKPAPRVRKETEPKEEPIAASAPPPVIIPEFIQAAEAEERAAKEAPEEKPKVAAKAPSVAPPIAAAPAGGMAGTTPKPAMRTGPTGPRARTVPSTSRPNYAGQQPAPNFRPASPR